MTGHKLKSVSDIEETAQTNKQYGEELHVVNDIENSPFKHVKTEKHEFIALGNFIVHTCTLEEAKKLVEEKDWNIIFNTMIILIENLSNIKNNK